MSDGGYGVNTGQLLTAEGTSADCSENEIQSFYTTWLNPT